MCWLVLVYFGCFEKALSTARVNLAKGVKVLVWRYRGVLVLECPSGKLWLQHMPPLQEGDSIAQSSPVTDLEEIYAAFQKEWMARWDRHRNTPDTKWEPIVDFVQHVFPDPPQMQYTPITFDTWQDAVRKKKACAAIGPDGVSKQDLLALPRSHVEPILAILQAVETGTSAWPAQVVTGHVHALEKIPGAWRASQYRPLTVFSIVYRTWSSIRARETLAFLGKYVPDLITGNVPGKSCTDLWLSVQVHLEEAHLDSVPLAGVVADLVKAFNLLPRIPLLAIGLHLGLPLPIIRAWNAALGQMTRAFSVRGTIGPQLSSTTGFAEGCGLSCTAMLLCNITLTRWLRIRHPSVRLWSYVDNLELTAPDISTAEQGLSLMTTFCELLDLQIDQAKTYFWSTDAVDRAAARDQALPLLSSTRDLGAHMEYGKRTTNHVLCKRIVAMPPVWLALARSPAPYRQKVNALKIKGWPQALSGCTAASLGEVHFRSLRTGACRGLKVHAPGISPMVHLSLVEHPLTDPECHALLQTVHTFRRHADLEKVCSLIDNILNNWREMLHRPGPCHVLLERLHALGWQWLGHGWMLDHLRLPIDLLRGSTSEVQQRLYGAWQHLVQRRACHRKTFQGLEGANATFTMEKIQHLAQDKLGLLRKALNGTFFTADSQAHNKNAHTLTCKFCGKPDSQHHRFWECQHFESCRPHPSVTRKAQAGDLPKCLTYHGWIGLPPEVLDLHRVLLALPDLTGSFEQLPFAPTDIFVDGSCANPTCSHTRIAGWGVVAADPNDPDGWCPLAQGIVPGWRQSSLRAEILAATSAFRFAVRQGTPMRLWSDNALVVDTLQAALSAPDNCQPPRKDADLWDPLLALARSLPAGCVQVHKIASHQKLEGADPVEIWAFTGNSHADFCAQMSVRYPHQVFLLWQKAVAAIGASRALRDKIHDTILQVSAAAVLKEARMVPIDVPTEQYPLPLTEATIGPLPAYPQLATSKLVGTAWSALSEWSRTLIDPDAEIRFLPWLYLYIDFALRTNLGGAKPSNQYKKWSWIGPP